MILRMTIIVVEIEDASNNLFDMITPAQVCQRASRRLPSWNFSKSLAPESRKNAFEVANDDQGSMPHRQVETAVLMPIAR